MLNCRTSYSHGTRSKTAITEFSSPGVAEKLIFFSLCQLAWTLAIGVLNSPVCVLYHPAKRLPAQLKHTLKIKHFNSSACVRCDHVHQNCGFCCILRTLERRFGFALDHMKQQCAFCCLTSSVMRGNNLKPDVEPVESLGSEKHVWSVFTKSLGFQSLKIWDVTTPSAGVTTMSLARFAPA